jgi:hypothetical protein
VTLDVYSRVGGARESLQNAIVHPSHYVEYNREIARNDVHKIKDYLPGMKRYRAGAAGDAVTCIDLA